MYIIFSLFMRPNQLTCLHQLFSILCYYGSVNWASLNDVCDHTAFSCKCSESLVLQEEAFNVEVPSHCAEGRLQPEQNVP